MKYSLPSPLGFLVLASLFLPLLAVAQPGGGRGLRLPDRNASPPPPADWSLFQWVAIGSLDAVQTGPVMKSFPPIYNHTLSLTLSESLRGPFKAGAPVSAHHAARQHEQPTFPEGGRVLVGGKLSRTGQPVVLRIEKTTAASEEVLRNLMRLPLGWVTENQRMVSPWAAVPGYSWKAEILGNTPTCSVTGQPAHRLPSGLTWSVSFVPSEAPIKWTNPDGDGLVQISLLNDTDQPVVIPSLVRERGEVRWDAAVVIQHKGIPQTLSRARPVAANAIPVTLNPGESVATQLDLFQLVVPEWPRGGYRIEFLISFADASETLSFYYMSRHHDALRAQRAGPSP